MQLIKNWVPLIAVAGVVGVFTASRPSQAQDSADVQLATGDLAGNASKIVKFVVMGPNDVLDGKARLLLPRRVFDVHLLEVTEKGRAVVPEEIRRGRE